MFLNQCFFLVEEKNICLLFCISTVDVYLQSLVFGFLSTVFLLCLQTYHLKALDFLVQPEVVFYGQ